MPKELLRKHHPIRHAKSFKYAFKGIFHAMMNEANFRVQLIFTVLLVIFAFIVGINAVEWSLLTISLGFLLSAEMVNTVVEEFIDRLITEHDEGARIIKDLSAGFVLTSAIVTLIVALLIFGPKVYLPL